MHREIVRYGFIPIFSIHDMRRTISARDFNEISFVNGGGLGRLFRSRVTRLESLSIPFVIIYSSDISVYFHSSSLCVISALRSLTRRGRRREKDRRRRRRRRASWMSLTRFAHYRDLASILISHLADVPDDEWFIDPNPISPTL